MSIRVLIVDDSAFIRRAVRRMLAVDPELEVVGEAGDGRAALRDVAALAPDVVTLDLRMPGLDGLETLEHLMAARPTPVVLLSSYAQADAALTVRALAAGAVDFVDKSRVSTMDVYELGNELVGKLKAAASSRPRPAENVGAPAWLDPAPRQPPALVVLGASTGGPAAIERVLGAFAARRAVAVLVVQHMPAGFTAALTRRLAAVCDVPVREARGDDRLRPGLVLVAPGGHDLAIVADGDGARVDLGVTPGRALPRLDPVLESAAAIYGAATCAVVLTGMGRDGVDGARRVRAAGGTVIAEAASTCTVFGMPRAVIEAGLASCVAPLGSIATVLGTLAGAPGGRS